MDKTIYKKKFNEARILNNPNDVRVGMHGEDYNSNKGIVLAVGPVKKMLKFDNYGSWDNDSIAASTHAVLVRIDDDDLLYAYDDSGFLCSNDDINGMISECNLMSKYQR